MDFITAFQINFQHKNYRFALSSHLSNNKYVVQIVQGLGALPLYY